MKPTPSDVHVNTPLTNISVAYLQSQSEFIADKVFPVVPVSHQSDRYYTYSRGDFNRDEAQLRAPSTESAGGGYTVDNTPNYYCNVYAFHKDIDDQLRANADNVLNLDNEATAFVTHKMLIKRERIWATKYFNTGIWSNNRAGASSNPSAGTSVYHWSDYTNSDPITDIRNLKVEIKKNTGFTPNKLVLGEQVYAALIDHPDLLDRVKYGQTAGKPAQLNKELLAQILELDEILVGGSIYNTAKEGQAESSSFILGKHALLVYAAPTPGLMTPSGGYTFSWTGYLGAGAFGNRMKKFRMDSIHSDRIEGEMAFDCKLVGADLGCFFNGIIA